MTINMGPHHPATHGVLRLLVSLEGEVVRDLKPIVGYVHTGIEKNCEDKSLLEGDPVRRADGLPLLLLQHAGVLRLRRAAARARDPAARRVPAGDPPGAEPDPLPPGLARHLGARPRRDVDVLLLLPRPRPDPRPVRDVDRPADAHPLLPGRRRLRGHPGRLRAQAARVLRRDARRGSTSTRRSSTATRSSSSAPRTSASCPASGCSTSASPARCCAPPASRGTCARSTPYLAYDDFDFKIPVGTVGDGYDRYRVRVQEMRESVRIIEQASTACPRGRGSPTTARSCCRRATSSRPRWRR